MSDTSLPIDLLVSAQTRIASREGIPIVVLQRGDINNGTIILKINLLNGNTRVFTQVRFKDELVWSPISRHDFMPEAEADRYLETQTKFDPDSWLIEIEDKQGRLWFPGKVISFAGF